MIVLTENEKEKEYYITKVIPDEDYKAYTVYYANGKMEKYPFSVHNFNVDINRMVKAYYQYKESFKQRIMNIKILLSLEQLTFNLLAVIISSTAADMADKPIQKLVIKFLAYLLIFRKYRSTMLKKKEYDFYLTQLEQIKEYINNKDVLKVQVIDPVFKSPYDWYLFNLSEFDNVLFDPSNYEYLKNELTPEIRTELGKTITKEINGEKIL